MISVHILKERQSSKLESLTLITDSVFQTDGSTGSDDSKVQIKLVKRLFIN